MKSLDKQSFNVLLKEEEKFSVLISMNYDLLQHMHMLVAGGGSVSFQRALDLD